MKALYRLLTVLILVSSAIPFTQAVLAQQNPIAQGQQLPIAGQEVFDIARDQSVVVEEILGSKGSIFIFWSNQCAWTKRYLDRLESLAANSDPQGVRIILVNSNNKRVFPKERLEESRRWERSHPEFVYISDEDAAIARAFGAERTPQVFAFNAGKSLIYKGAIDDSPGDASQVTSNYVAQVVSYLLDGSALAENETKAFGCQIRY